MGSKLHNSCSANESLRSNLQKTRKKKGYKTQEAFAEALDVSVETVRNWEQGRALPELGTLFRICTLLDCDVDYLIGRLDVPTHDLAFIQSQTRLSEAAIEKLIRIASRDRATGNSKMLSRFIENDNFEYLIALLNSNAGESEKAFSARNAYLQINNQAIVRYERDRVFHEIAQELEVYAEPASNERILYILAYNLFHEGRFTEQQLQDIIEHYDNGDFDYVPQGWSYKNNEAEND